MLNPYRYLTIIGLIALCSIIFAAEQLSETSWGNELGAVPTAVVAAYEELIRGEWSLSTARNLSRLLTANFLHGDIAHIGLNMVFLWAFGYLTSQALGQWRTLVIFLICGVCGGILHVWFEADSPAPMVGASGAISGLAGVYLGLAVQWRLPYAEVWPLAHPVPPAQVALFAVFGFIGDMVLLARHDQQIAYGAHLGGLLTGVVIAAIITTIFPSIESYNRASRMRRG
jgi:membrane associated rhomboid family serine protease